MGKVKAHGVIPARAAAFAAGTNHRRQCRRPRVHQPSPPGAALKDLARVEHSERIEHGLDLALNIELVVTEFIP